MKRYDDNRSSDDADGSNYDYNNDNDRENFCPASQEVSLLSCSLSPEVRQCERDISCAVTFGCHVCLLLNVLLF